jgi:hypothetical protein
MGPDRLDLSALGFAACLHGCSMSEATHAVHYRIIVEGVLDPLWRSCVGGLAVIEQQEPGRPASTLLEGPLADLSALQGVLDTLFMLDLRPVLVEQLPDGSD